MNASTKSALKYVIPIILLMIPLMCSSQLKVSQQDDKTLAVVFEQSLQNDLLRWWYPAVIDTIDGGYLSNFSFDWQPASYQPKMLVSQSRHVWTSSQAAMFLSDIAYTRYARHGFEFMKNQMWDTLYGGFFNIRAKDGSYLDRSFKNEKRAYGNTFAIYGLTAYYNLTHNPQALQLAQSTFYWLDTHSHDSVYGGYFDIMDQQGNWLYLMNEAPKGDDWERRPWKDHNSSIHLLESFTELYKVWPDKLLRARLGEMLTVVRDSLIDPKGFLILHTSRNWTPISLRDSTDEVVKQKYFIDHVSFGHDVETAFLLLEASHALGLENDTLTLSIGRRLVDHALHNGFDSIRGGFYYAGFYHRHNAEIDIINRQKPWWVQAEGLNALLLMSKIFPHQNQYHQAFLKQWNYITQYQIDPNNGEWYEWGIDEKPNAGEDPKATIWKVNYHNSRAMMNCIRMLRNENEVALHFAKLADNYSFSY